MNLTVTPVNYQTKTPQNISHKGFLNKLFKPNTNKITKDVFVSTIAATGIITSQLVKEATSKTAPLNNDEQRVYANFNCIEKGVVSSHSFANTRKVILKDLENFSSNSVSNFIKAVLNCITNADKDKMFRISTANGIAVGLEGEFLSNVCTRLLALQGNSELKNNSTFVEQLTEDIEISKQIIQGINDNDWESIKHLEMKPKSLY